MEREPNKRLGAHHTAQVKAGCFGALRSWESESDFGFQCGFESLLTGDFRDISISSGIMVVFHRGIMGYSMGSPSKLSKPDGKIKRKHYENVLAGKIPCEYGKIMGKYGILRWAMKLTS